jgi:hypothetical protein
VAASAPSQLGRTSFAARAAAFSAWARPHEASGSRLARKRGWRTIEAGGDDPLGARVHPQRWIGGRDQAHVASVMALLDASGSLPDYADDLERARSALHPEGLLVVATRTAATPATPHVHGNMRYALTPRSVRTLLNRAGFQLIEWLTIDSSAPFDRLRAPRASMVGAIAVARASATVARLAESP